MLRLAAAVAGDGDDEDGTQITELDFNEETGEMDISDLAIEFDDFSFDEFDTTEPTTEDSVVDEPTDSLVDDTPVDEEPVDEAVEDTPVVEEPVDETEAP